MKEVPASLLDKYYEGLTTSGEELQLREAVAGAEGELPEKDIFSYYLSGSQAIPEGLEEGLFDGVDRKIRNRSLRLRIIRWSTAAVLLLLAGVFGWVEQEKSTREKFRTMEEALSMVSQSLQPEEEEPEMLVLWVDDNVEVIFQ